MSLRTSGIPMGKFAARLCLPALLAFAGCGQGEPAATPAFHGADSTRFRAELAAARALLAEGDIDRAEPMVRAILAAAPAPALVKQRAMATGYLGNIMQRRNLLDSAAACHRAVILLAQRHGQRVMEATARINLGVVLEMQGDHAGALEQQLEAFHLKEQQGDSTGMARGLNNIGMLYVRTGDTLKARDHFLRSIAINARVGRPGGRTGDSASWHRGLMNLAVVEMDRGRYDTAWALLQRSAEVCPRRMYNSNAPALLTNMALAREGLADTAGALALYRQALANAREAGDEWSLGEVRHYLADLLVRMGKPAAALAHLDTALAITRSLGDRGSEKNVLLSQAGALAAAGRYEAAFRAHQAYSALADSLMNAGKDAVMRELHVKYGVQRKERENERLRAEAELASVRAKGLWRLAVAALLLAAAVGVLARLLAQRARQRASAREAELEQQALRLQMDPHFLFNALNTIPGLYASTDARTATAYVGHLSNLLRSILDTSRMAQVSLRQELDLIDHYVQVCMARHPGVFRCTVELAPGLDPDEALLPPMLLQPLVENAITHGLVPRKQGGQLRISTALEGGLLACTVCDNGVGRSAQKARDRMHGLDITGQRLRLGHWGKEGSLTIEDLKDAEGRQAGTCVTIRLPHTTTWE